MHGVIAIGLLGGGLNVLGVDPSDAPPSIYGGEEVADDQSEAATVAVRAGAVLCTGTVVHPRVVLTAAHCIENAPDRDPSTYSVLFGKEILVRPAASVAVSALGVHPDYGGPDCEKDCFDLAYLVLDGEVFLDAYPTPIVDQDEYDALLDKGAEVRLVGYGRDEASNVGTKRFVDTEIQGFSKSGLEFVAGGDGKDSCLGDSGGPALVSLPGGGQPRLAGVLSRGEDCGEGGVYGNPYGALCWVREETSFDIVEGCGDCDCLDLSKIKKRDDGCAVAPLAGARGRRRDPGPILLVAGLLGVGLSRRQSGRVRP